MNIGETKLSQSAAFFGGEGDAWYARNRHTKPNPIVISERLKPICKPKIIVEMGCGNGRYLDPMQEHWNCHCIGYDPSTTAIKEGRQLYPALDLRRGSARAFYGMPIDVLVF